MKKQRLMVSKKERFFTFRVRGVNKAGTGEPSDPSDPHTVKHKNLKPRIDRTNLKAINY